MKTNREILEEFKKYLQSKMSPRCSGATNDIFDELEFILEQKDKEWKELLRKWNDESHKEMKTLIANKKECLADQKEYLDDMWKEKMIEMLEGLTNPEDWHGWEGYGRHTNAEIKEQINNLKQL